MDLRVDKYSNNYVNSIFGSTDALYSFCIGNIIKIKRKTKERLVQPIMKIIKVDTDYLKFEDGSEITADHDQD